MTFTIAICLFAVSSFFARSHSWATGLSQDLASRQLQSNGVPSTANFISRAYQASIVIGDYLYIDGGEINFYDNGVPTHLPDNNTYSIDLTSSWTNESVTFNQIEKKAPVLNYVSLWKDASDTTFYAYGGEVSGISFGQPKVIPPNGLWHFTPNGNGGSWSEVGISSNSIFPSLTRQAGAAGASGDGAGYLLGGYNLFVPIPGIMTYNMSSGVWANNSAAGFSTYGTAEYGQMQFVPNVAENGLLVILGGETSDDVRWYDNGSNLLSFGTIYMYNPSSNTWHNQTASGTIPESRDRFCSVGVQGDNGTFEIFMMGGHVASTIGLPQASVTQMEQEQNIALDEVFVLSLPAFNWQKADYTPVFPRIDHSCNVIGKRQMVVIGGENPAAANGTALVETLDIWHNGIGIFDMTNMEWSDQYDASAADYVTPEKVKSWIRQNGPYPSTWDDPTVKGYFVRPTASTNSTPSPSGTSSPSSSRSSSNAGAIAGGVVGGIVGLALIAGLLWFFLRRWKQPRPQAHSKRSMEHVLEKLGFPRSELPSDKPLARPVRSQGSPRSELPSDRPLARPVRSQDAPHELPNTSIRTDGARHEMQA